MQYFGIDVHPTTLRVTVLQEDLTAETHRYDNTPSGRQALTAALQAQPAAVAIGEATGADELRRELASVAEKVLVVAPSEVFAAFPELGKKTHNLARMAHRAVHEARVDGLLKQSVSEVKRLVEVQRTEVEKALAQHLGDFEQQAILWTDAGQAWLEETLGTLPSEVQTAVRDGLGRIHTLCSDSLEIERLMPSTRGAATPG